MKPSRILKSHTIIIFMILAYLLVLVGGHFFIFYASFGMHRSRYLAICESYTTIYETVHHVGGMDHVGVGIVYSPDGSIEYTFGKPAFFSMHQDYLQQKGLNFYKTALSGQEVYTFLPFAPDKSEFGYTSLIYSMLPVYQNENIVGVLCYIFEAQNFLQISFGYVVIITLFAALITVITVMHNKEIIKYDEAQKNYVNNVTHELKAPVASIKALAEALTDNMDKDENEREIYYGLILKEANRQDRMVRNILTLSRIQSGFDDFSISKVPADEIFNEVCEQYSSRCTMLDIDFIISDAIGRLPTLKTNAHQIKLLLDILLSNAIKFADPDNGIVSISAQPQRRELIICIKDNGIGISEEDLPHICERFYRAGTASTYSGSGIGLSIADEIVKNLNEKMWFESTLGQGTSAFFTIQISN